MSQLSGLHENRCLGSGKSGNQAEIFATREFSKICFQVFSPEFRAEISARAERLQKIGPSTELNSGNLKFETPAIFCVTGIRVKLIKT